MFSQAITLTYRHRTATNIFWLLLPDISDQQLNNHQFGFDQTQNLVFPAGLKRDRLFGSANRNAAFGRALTATEVYKSYYSLLQSPPAWVRT